MHAHSEILQKQQHAQHPRKCLCRYDLGKVLGAGSFGIVREAVGRRTGAIHRYSPTAVLSSFNQDHLHACPGTLPKDINMGHLGACDLCTAVAHQLLQLCRHPLCLQDHSQDPQARQRNAALPAEAADGGGCHGAAGTLPGCRLPQGVHLLE